MPTTRERAADAARRILDVLVARRYVVLVCGAVLLWLAQRWVEGGESGDWFYFIAKARSLHNLPSIGVGAYIGPLAWLLAVPFAWVSPDAGWAVCSALCMALGVVSIRWLESAAALAGQGSQDRRERTVLIGGLFLLYAWSVPGVLAGHADDVLALASVALALRAVAGGRWVLASLAMAAAIDSKPWAALVIPLAGACVGSRVRGLVLTGACVGLSWLPFVLLQPGGLDLGALNLPVTQDSGLHYLGAMVGSRPGWARELQLAVALPLGVYAMARERWYLVPAIAFAVRVNLDPATVNYYQAGPVVGLFVWDVVRPLRLTGMRTAIGCVALLLLPQDLGTLQIFGPSVKALDAVLRLLVALVPIGFLLSHGRKQSSKSS